MVLSCCQTQLLHSKMHAQNTALTLKDACSKHSSYTQRCMLKTQLLHSKMHAQNTALTLKDACSKHSSYTQICCAPSTAGIFRCYAQNTALTPQSAMLRTRLSHPKLKHFVSKILYKNKLRLKVLDLRALTFAEERSRCLQDPVRNR